MGICRIGKFEQCRGFSNMFDALKAHFINRIITVQQFQLNFERVQLISFFLFLLHASVAKQKVIAEQLKSYGDFNISWLNNQAHVHIWQYIKISKSIKELLDIHTIYVVFYSLKKLCLQDLKIQQSSPEKLEMYHFSRWQKLMWKQRRLIAVFIQ